ncbi:MAG TPA: GNAT family N-acetyltransferase [Kofleriaceae bacterium]|nr:GNAT family N-acetyltransferase [Kofleriaceae bacterium]
MNVLVRGARVGDAEAVARVHSESWRLAYGGVLSARYLAGLDEEVLVERWRKRLEGRGERRRLLVAEEDGAVVGFSLFGPCDDDRDLVGFAGEVQMLYVLPSAQRRGHGRALLDRAAAAMAAAPLYWMVVWVVEVNHAARAFYRRVGLEPDGRRKTDRLEGEPVDVVRYAGPLNRVALGDLFT